MVKATATIPVKYNDGKEMTKVHVQCIKFVVFASVITYL